MTRVCFLTFIVFAVVVKAFPKAPALDSDGILFLESRSFLGLVSAILSHSKLIILKALTQNLKKEKNFNLVLKAGLVTLLAWLVLNLLALLFSLISMDNEDLKIFGIFEKPRLIKSIK